MKTTSLPRNIANKLFTLAQKNSAEETCGLIGAINGSATTVYSVENITAEKHRLFAMNPAKQIAAIKQMRDKDETLFAIYHSHPCSPAEPSLLDMQQAGYPDAVYLIISLNTKGVLEMKGFYLNDSTAEEIGLVYT
jgi:proteasome lid subunit RPN8/RPN11